MSIPLDITLNVQFLRGIEYEHASYYNIKDIAKRQDVTAIKSLLSGGNGGTSDNLLIYLLKQNGEVDRLVIVLDKFEPWSGPLILDIF